MRALAFIALAACTNPEAAVVRQYAVNMESNYRDVVTKLEALQSAVDAFVAAPSQAGLDAAKQAWLDARPAYGECEASRFYAGPIDKAQGTMNEWPIDENFIDYTAGNPSAGIINDPSMYPQINPAVLAAADQRGGIENLSTGFHAIEFLLWGQRVDQSLGPGTRPYTDYVDSGTAAHADRRRMYLQTATSMLLSDMKGLDAEWDLSDPNSYASGLLAGAPHDGVTKVLRGMSNMAISELLYERLNSAVITHDRKDQESCFSESTSIDLAANALGVEDVYLGRYGSTRGPSVSDLVHAKDAALDGHVRDQLTAIRAALDAIPPPFDHAVVAPDGSDAHQKVQAAIDTFTPLRDTLVQVGQTLSVSLNL